MMKSILMIAVSASALFLTSQNAKASTDSRVTFYDRPAKWLFDLIKQPTSIRHFTMGREIGIVGATQIQLTENIECTLHGKTKKNPKSSAESSLALCSLRADNLDAIFSQGTRGSFSFNGETAKLVFDLLPKTDYSFPDTDDFSGRGPVTGTRTMKSYGEIGTDGINCTHVDYLDEQSADKTNCSFSWRK